MRVRYQRGYLRLRQRKTGPDRWELLWWDSEPTGVRVRRKAIIGTVQFVVSRAGEAYDARAGDPKSEIPVQS